MAESAKVLNPNGFGKTQRRDIWWIEPLIIAIVFSAFGMYATWAAFQGENYEWGPYLSPFYSPNLPEWFPALFGWWPFSPALLILGAPLIFRATCYYYRKAYYRSYFMNPPGCAVAGPDQDFALGVVGRNENYKGETAFPLILQNLHRYTFYLAAIFIFILAYDAIIGFFHKDGHHLGLGNVIMTVNVVLLGLYTFSCHSWRHILGGCIDCFSCDGMSKARNKAWTKQSKLNEHHMAFAWASLLSVGLTDLYIRLLAAGTIQETWFF